MIGSSSWQAGGATGVGDMHAVLLDAIRLAVGRLFLTAEPTLARTYAQLYATKTSRGYRCQNCYHLFGVDLIADAQRAMRVIEVSTAPSRTALHSFPIPRIMMAMTMMKMPMMVMTTTTVMVMTMTMMTVMTGEHRAGPHTLTRPVRRR